MTLPVSGAISLNQVEVELTYVAGSTISMNDAAVRALTGIASGAISFDNLFGKTFAAGVGTTWVAQPGLNTATPNAVFNSIAWSGTKFVAAGGDYTGSYCATSPDGVIWTNQASLRTVFGAGNLVYKVIWNGAKFLAIGGNGGTACKCATSTDGITWAAQASLPTVIGAANMFSVCWTGTQFVAVGGNTNTMVAKCATSPDGVTWTARAGLATAVGATSNAYDVAWNGTRLVATVNNQRIAYSADGITWTKVTTNALSSSNIVWTGAQFVITGLIGQTPTSFNSYCSVVTSPDGITWTNRRTETDYNISYGGVCWSGTQLMVIGNSYCLSSPDGITWTVQNSLGSGAPGSYNSVCWTGAKFVAVGYGVCATSSVVPWSSGAWTNRTSTLTTLFGSGQSINTVKWNGWNFVALGGTFGSAGRLAVSTNGTDWTNSNMPSLPSDALTVTCSNGLKQIASGYNGSFFSSLDGVTWSALPAAAVPWYTTSFTYFTVYDMVWIGTKFVAVGSGSTTVGGCATSPDGVTWTRQAGLSTAMTSGTAKAAAWNGSILVVVGNIPTGASGCATSPDGVTWTSRTGLAALTAGNSAQRTFQDVVWTGTKFVVVGDDANTGVGGFCATSPDGITWTKQAGFPAGAGMQLVWTGSLLVAIGANKAMATSPDGITWTASTSLSTSINDTNVQASTMASNGSSLVVIGTNTTTAAPVYFTSP